MGTFFNPFESQKGGGGGGGGDSSTYSVRKIVDSVTEQVSYRLTKTTNGSTIDVGEVIAFTGDEVLVDYDGQTILLNAAVENLKELAEQGKQEVTFSSLEIDTHNKTLSQLSAELAAKNLEEGTVVTGRIYSEALPYNNYGNAEVLVNNSIFWWKTSSSTISPYSWNAIVVGNTVKMDWTPTYYQLPIASAQSLGGVKIGDNVQIAPDGTISVITTKGDTGTGIASIAKTSSSGLNDIYTITYTDSTTSTFTVTNGATITGGSIGQTGHLILTMSDGRTIDAGALPTDNEVEVTTTSSQPADPNVELWVDLSTQQTLDIPEINDSSTSSIQDTWSCKKIYDEQQRQDNEISYAVNTGVKNLASINITSGEYIGFTVTATRETVTVESGATAPSPTANFRILTPSIALKAGTYEITGCPATGTDSTYRLDVRYTGSSGTNVIAADYGDGKSFTLTQDSTVGIYMRFDRSYTVTTPITFKPMLCLKSLYDSDSSYQPYARTNVELTVENDSQQSEIDYVVNTGVKNLFKNTAVSKTYLGVTFTVNEDGTVSLSGAATTAAGVLEIGTITPPAGSYIVSGCPAGGSWAPNPNKYRIRIAKNGTWLGDETGTGYTVTVNGSDVISLQINSAVGFDTAGLVFKPMIRPASITDSTFQPYALPNTVLTPALIEQVDEGAKNLVSWDIPTVRSLNPNATWTSDDTCVKGGITYKFNTDGTVVANGTADTSSSKYIKLKSGFSVTKGLIASCGLPAVSQDQSKGLLQLEYPAGSALNVYDYERSEEVNRDGTVILYITVLGGVTVSNLIFRPMICTAADWAVSQKFVPYKSVSNGYSETELLAAPILGDSASSISPISLLDSISNYDQLVFQFGVTSENLDQRMTQTILCSDIQGNNSFILCGYPSNVYNLYYRVTKNTDTSFTVNDMHKNGWAETATIFSIKGIKY